MTLLIVNLQSIEAYKATADFYEAPKSDPIVAEEDLWEKSIKILITNLQSIEGQTIYIHPYVDNVDLTKEITIPSK